ncbi:hypothetical protein J3458_009587 [Metarhizium acridum]|uniref:uncharacterized protein n=1 Tax=Metarhizium acridum TaxID=92637 RepID=UPI001C6CFEC2|nr:hypothetical protein J3458_009587 [Metarhizium acridum]
MIPSDTEGGLDIDDTDGDNGCRGVGWHSDDTLLSADALVPSHTTASPDDACYIDAFGCESDDLANNIRRLGTPTDDRLNQDTTETKPYKSVVASDDIPEGSLTQPPSPKRSGEEGLREVRGRAPNADKERTQTHQRSNPNFNVNADTRPRSNGDNETQGYQEGLEHGIPPGLSSLPPRGDGKANDTPDIDQHVLKRRRAHKSMARVDSCSRKVHRELSHPITASKPKTTSETSSSYDSVVRGDQEYSPPARNSDATEALSESCYTDDGSDHHARKRRKLRRSSTRGKPRQRRHAASPSSRPPPSNDKQDEGDPRALSAPINRENSSCLVICKAVSAS